MESWLIDAITAAAPGSLASVAIVYMFVKYIGSRDALMQRHIDQVQDALNQNNKSLKTNSEALGRCAEAQKNSADALEKACRTMDRLHHKVNGGS